MVVLGASVRLGCGREPADEEGLGRHDAQANDGPLKSDEGPVVKYNADETKVFVSEASDVVGGLDEPDSTSVNGQYLVYAEQLVV